MTDEERDALLMEIWDRLERVQNDHGSALRALRGELNAIRVVLTGDRAQHYELAERGGGPGTKGGLKEPRRAARSRWSFVGGSAT